MTKSDNRRKEKETKQIIKTIDRRRKQIFLKYTEEYLGIEFQQFYSYLMQIDLDKFS